MQRCGAPHTSTLEGMENERRRLAEKLEGVLSGTIDLNAVLHDAPSYGESMKHCYHGLQHYLADSDIRAKDPTYRSMQDSEMLKLIALLRSDVDPTMLSRVSFVGVS